MRDSWRHNFRTKDGRQVALTGYSRSSEIRAQWTDVSRQSSHRRHSARTDENNDQVNDMVLSQEDQPELTAQSVKYHGRQAFLSHLLSASYKKICSWNASRGDVRKSWLRRTALLVSYFWRSFPSLPRTLSSLGLHMKRCSLCGFSAESWNKMWKSVKISPT